MSLLSYEITINLACRVRPPNQMEIAQGGQISVTYNEKNTKN